MIWSLTTFHDTHINEQQLPLMGVETLNSPTKRPGGAGGPPSKTSVTNPPAKRKSTPENDRALKIKDDVRRRMLSVIDAHLRKHGLSLREFCDSIGFPDGNVSQWRRAQRSLDEWPREDGNPGVRDERWPSIDHIVLLCPPLGVTAQYLCFGGDPTVAVRGAPIDLIDQDELNRLRRRVAVLEESVRDVGGLTEDDRAVLASFHNSGLSPSEIDRALIYWFGQSYAKQAAPAKARILPCEDGRGNGSIGTLDTPPTSKKLG